MSGIESVVTQVSRDDDGDVLLTQNRPTGTTTTGLLPSSVVLLYCTFAAQV